MNHRLIEQRQVAREVSSEGVDWLLWVVAIAVIVGLAVFAHAQISLGV